MGGSHSIFPPDKHLKWAPISRSSLAVFSSLPSCPEQIIHPSGEWGRTWISGSVELGKELWIRTSRYLSKGMKSVSWRDIRTPMFTAALFTIAKVWKQQQVSVKRWIDKENEYIYNGILFSFKKEGTSAICNKVDELREHYAKWNKPDTERQSVHSITYMWNLKM